MVKKSGQGQSLVEVVFSVGVIIIVLTAVISLVISSLHSRTSGYDRKKAAELGQKVVEQLVEEENQDGSSFWDVGSSFWTENNGTTQPMGGYPGYFYAINFVQRINAGIGCSVTPVVCADATIGIGYSGDNNDQVTFTRFFNR